MVGRARRRSLCRPSRGAGAWALPCAAALAIALAAPAQAQRPFVAHDPFYQEESARRAFFDGFAAQAEVSYRAAEPFAEGTVAGGPLALALRFDYALTRSVDVAAVFDASGGVNGAGTAPVRLSWLVAKPYWRAGHTDYAVRIAVDPVTEGGFGFRQTDVAFVSTTDLSLHHTTDLTVGVRRAHVGIERLELEPELRGSPHLGLRTEIVRSRAVGTELHGAWGHRFLLDPGGSHVFVSVAAEAMDYDLVTTRLGSGDDPPEARRAAERPRESRYRGGTARLRAGIEYSRPSFRLAPYVSVPMVRVVETEQTRRAAGPRPTHARLGLRLMVR